MSTSLFLAVLAISLQATDPAAGPETPVAAPPAAEQAPLYTAPTVRPFEMPAGLEASAFEPADVPALTEAVKLDAYNRSYEGPKTSVEQVYERGVRGAFESAQVRMGTLDGQWSVAGLDGAPLMTLLLNDSGQGEIDGAWRDLRAGPGMFGSGLLLSVAREGATVVIRYAPREGEPPCELRLRPGADGRFVGALRTAAGERSVVMTRT